MESGTIKKIDGLGRITIPKEWRDSLVLEEHTPVEMYFFKDKISIKKYARSCAFCGSKKNLVTYNDKKICCTCANAVSNMFKTEH